jgi:hypothetical protein
MSIMLDAKNARKRAEADVQLLANRLQHLRVAEERARKKICETKARTGEILSLKKRNMEHQQSKMNYQMERELNVSTEQKRITGQRTASRKNASDSKEVVERARKAQAGAQREQMQKMSKWREEELKTTAEKNKQKTQATRDRREDVRKKREAEKEQQAQQQQQQYAKKISAEAGRTKDAEGLIMRMEQEEAALIERLRKTQEMQRQAYEELQQTLQL